MAKEKGTRIAASPFVIWNSGGRIRTSDLRVMSPTSYQAALPRDQFSVAHLRSQGGGVNCDRLKGLRSRLGSGFFQHRASIDKLPVINASDPCPAAVAAFERVAAVGAAALGMKVRN